MAMSCGRHGNKLRMRTFINFDVMLRDAMRTDASRAKV